MKSVLLLYDNTYYSDQLKSLLERHGVYLQVHYSVLSSIQYLENHADEFAAVICHENAGELDVGTIVSEIRSTKPNMPILGLAESEATVNYLTSFGMEGAFAADITEGLAINISEFITMWGNRY